MNANDVLKQVKKDKVEFISLQISDISGVIREIIIPVSELEGAFKHGKWFDGSSVEGFARIQESDLFLKPDPSTYAIIPWLNEHGRTARLICDIYNSKGEPFEGDPRLILKKTVQFAQTNGYNYNVGPELEFYLFRKFCDNKTLPIDNGSYFELTSNEGLDLMKEIILALKSFGINVETSHHECGEGQYEIDFEYGPALMVADRMLTLKYVVKKIAQLRGMQATFMAKPIYGVAGSGMHVHQSLFDIKNSRNAFFDKNDKYKLSSLAYNFIAGQLNHIKAMCAVLCPTVNSYKRLVSGFEAPVYIMWASSNRSALIRIPKFFEGKPESTRIELRCPDPTCNPYLAFSVMLKAGLEGVKSNLTPPEPVEENVYQFNYEALNKKGIELLPNSLFEALNEFKRDQIVAEALGQHLFEKYVDIKTKEYDEFKVQVTNWEIDKYLDAY